MRPRQKGALWWYPGLVWCRMFHHVLPGTSSNKSKTKYPWAAAHWGHRGDTDGLSTRPTP